MRLTHTYLIFPDQDIKIAVRSGNVAKAPTSVISTACPSCQGDMGRKELCKECGKVKGVDFKDVLKAIRVDKTTKSCFTKAQIDKLKETANVITVLGTTDRHQFPLKYLKDSQWILPDVLERKKHKELAEDEDHTSIWFAIHKAMSDKGTALIVKHSSSSVERLGVIMADTFDDHELVLYTLPFAQDLNKLEVDLKQPELSEEETQLGNDLIGMVKPVDWKTIEDDFRNKLMDLLTADETVDTEQVPKKAKSSMFDKIKKAKGVEAEN
tara:strand:- start:4642 stop:5445 length:804 start_codon:yes stop_codon:yes gene_type:complete